MQMGQSGQLTMAIVSAHEFRDFTNRAEWQCNGMRMRTTLGLRHVFLAA